MAEQPRGIGSAEAPRGVRNRNPGNIRKSQTHWLGEVLPGEDKDFCTFSAMFYGIRATGLIFLNYQRVHGMYTPIQMIGRWAPTNENDTAAYVSNVCHMCSINAAKAYTFSRENLTVFADFLHAVFHVENGGDYVSYNDIEAGALSALRA